MDERDEQMHSSTEENSAKTYDNYYYYDDGAKSAKKEDSLQKEKPEKKSGGFGKKFVKAIALGLAFGLFAGAAFTGANYAIGKVTGSNSLIDESAVSGQVIGNTSDSTSKSSGSGTNVSTTTVTDVSDLAESMMPSVVSVTNISVTQYRTMFGIYSMDSTSCGTGFIFDQDDDYLYIATNYHVISDSESVTVAFCDDSSADAVIAGMDEDQDLAVLKVQKSSLESSTLGAIKVAEIGNSDDLKVGQAAMVIGNALGYGQSVTTGVISALNREINISDNGQTFNNTVIQTDAAVNPGNSGGPLIDMDGKVIGIVNSKLSSTSVEGVGYAIPISRAYDIISELKDESASGSSDDSEVGAPGSDAFVGISGIDITNSMSKEYNKPVGVYISSVSEGSGAEKAGIEQGDVITEFDGQAVTSMEEIQTILIDLHPGDKVSVKVAKASNNYEEENVTVVLTEKPASN